MNNPTQAILGVLRDAQPEQVSPTRLATVVSSTATSVIVKFDGESVASTRPYKIASDHLPRVGERITMLRFGSTWVACDAIRGSITDYVPGVWVPYGINIPNVPMTAQYAKYMRIGNTVSVHAAITLTGAIGAALVDMPFAFASDTVFHESNQIGTVKALRTGVAWHTGNLAPITATPARAGIYVDGGAGAQFNASAPAAWVAGDRWGIDFTYEAAPLP